MRRAPTSLLIAACIGCASLPEGRDVPVPPGGVLGRASRVGAREVWVERIDAGPFTRIVARDPRGGVRTLVRSGSADRAVLSPDGAWVAFVYAPAGLAAIGVVPFDGGPPRQLTNLGLERRKGPGLPLWTGGVAEGFVPVPDGDSLTFVGAGSSLSLAWDTPWGPQSVQVQP